MGLVGEQGEVKQLYRHCEPCKGRSNLPVTQLYLQNGDCRAVGQIPTARNDTDYLGFLVHALNGRIQHAAPGQ